MIRNIFSLSRSLVILDAGHGVDTNGKRSPVWRDGSQLLEWEFNRYITSLLSRYLMASHISNIILVDEDKDMPLPMRSDLVNRLYGDYREDFFVYLVSIHGNAFEQEQVTH